MQNHEMRPLRETLAGGSNAEDMPFFASGLCSTCSGGFYFFLVLLFVGACVCVCIRAHDQYGMRVEARIQFCEVSSLSALTWILGIKPKSLGLHSKFN